MGGAAELGIRAERVAHLAQNLVSIRRHCRVENLEGVGVVGRDRGWGGVGVGRGWGSGLGVWDRVVGWSCGIGGWVGLWDRVGSYGRG